MKAGIRRSARELVDRYRITKGRGFRLSDIDPDDTAGLDSRERAQELLAQGVARLAKMQDMLYAQDQWALLLIFQAMDAAGKDGAIKHVFSGINPQGCQVFAFKGPTHEELDHDYLWRTTKCLPERGRIGIFNRSYYEEVLAVRVHPEFLDPQRLPRQLVTKKIWQERLEDIASFERYIARNGVAVLKFFLHVSRGEQKKRLLERLDTPEKNWKFRASDLHERDFWKNYMRCYEETIRATATPEAPWIVVPADNKWFTRLVVAAAIVERLDRMKLHYPEVTGTDRRELARARTELERERGSRRGKKK